MKASPEVVGIMPAGKLYVFNTLSGKEEVFVPLSGNEVRMFVCGQTVYDDSHLGHAKTYINFDVVARWIRHLGYNLKYIQNITDVDDKIVARAAETGEEPIELARRFESRFMEDMDSIGVRSSVDQYPRSHDYIENIRKQVQLLLDKDIAYVLDGDVYYDVARFPTYTQLSGMKLEELGRHRIEPREGKRNTYDFALWKKAKPGEPLWDIAVRAGGKEIHLQGRPGWHIEDTAITEAFFGPQYDIHGGARELIFPHHTNEIAQAEAAFGIKPFVKYWLHSGVLNVNGVKMSKSLKNFVRIRDIIEKYGAEALRLFILSTHYRKDVNYTESLMEDASRRLARMYSSMSQIFNAENGTGSLTDATVEGATGKFNSAMNDDFNTPLAISILHTFIEDARLVSESREGLSAEAKGQVFMAIASMSGILGILESEHYKEGLDKDAAELISIREKLRKEKRFDEADRIRERLKEEYGIMVEDSIYGVIWKKLM